MWTPGEAGDAARDQALTGIFTRLVLGGRSGGGEGGTRADQTMPKQTMPERNTQAQQETTECSAPLDLSNLFVSRLTKLLFWAGFCSQTGEP